MVKIGIIGGSGLDNPDILKNVKELDLTTAYGRPSSSLKTGNIGGVDVVLLARHGRAHTIPPTQVNYKANIAALKDVGCTHIIATTAVGSLREEIKRGDLVILDQFIDFTRHRDISFHESFSPDSPVHTPMAEPFNKDLRKLLINDCSQKDVSFHSKGTVVTIEGPRFSTKAESHMFRSWGADVINMSVAPEAVLANEAGIAYAAIAMSTDYDCWKDDEEPVSWEEILKVFKSNAQKVTNLILDVIPKIKSGDKNVVNYSADVELNIRDDKDNLSDRFSHEYLIRNVPDFPKPGIQFKDITTLLKDSEGLKVAIKQMILPFKDKKIDIVVGAESRGFIFGAAMAIELGAGFVPARKPGKLPAQTVSKEYQLEYGTDAIQIHKDAIEPGCNVLIVDDLIATGGTIKAVASLVQELGGNVCGMSFLVDLVNLHGDIGYPYKALIEYEVDE